MADFPDDAPPSHRRGTVPLPPFVGPHGSGAGGHVPHSDGSRPRWRTTPARLYTPPGGAAPRAVPEGSTPAPGAAVSAVPWAPSLPAPVAPEAVPGELPSSEPAASADPAADDADMLPAAPGEDRPYTPWPAEDTERPAPGAEAARDTHDGDGQTDDDWFEDDGRESDAHVAEPVSPTPAFNDLRGIEKLASSSAVAEDAPFRSAGNVKGVDVQGDERLDASADEDPVADAGTPRPSPFTASAEYAPPSPAPGSVGSRDVVAGALERIALRIRDGEMPLPGDLPASDEAALAAVLAAMLRLPTR